MTDVVERLRTYDTEDAANPTYPPTGLIADAIDEIERLRAALSQARREAQKLKESRPTHRCWICKCPQPDWRKALCDGCEPKKEGTV